MLHTRIKIVTDGNGDCSYFPQYRWCFLWLHFKEYDSGCYDPSRIRIQRNTIYKAQCVIDAKLKEYNHTKKAKQKKVRYVKYP